MPRAGAMIARFPLFLQSVSRSRRLEHPSFVLSAAVARSSSSSLSRPPIGRNGTQRDCDGKTHVPDKRSGRHRFLNNLIPIGVSSPKKATSPKAGATWATTNRWFALRRGALDLLDDLR